MSALRYVKESTTLIHQLQVGYTKARLERKVDSLNLSLRPVNLEAKSSLASLAYPCEKITTVYTNWHMPVNIPVSTKPIFTKFSELIEHECGMDD